MRYIHEATVRSSTSIPPVSASSSLPPSAWLRTTVDAPRLRLPQAEHCTPCWCSDFSRLFLSLARIAAFFRNNIFFARLPPPRMAATAISYVRCNLDTKGGVRGVPLPRAGYTGGVPGIPEPQIQLQPRPKKTVPSGGTNNARSKPAWYIVSTRTSEVASLFSS